MVSLEEIPNMRVVDLKGALKDLGLSTTGLKAELAERLTEALQGEQQQGGPPAAEAMDATPAAESNTEAAVEAEEAAAGNHTEPTTAGEAHHAASSKSPTEVGRGNADSGTPAEAAPADSKIAGSKPDDQAAVDAAEPSENARQPKSQQNKLSSEAGAAAESGPADADPAAEEPAAVPAKDSSSAEIAQVQPSHVSTTATEVSAAGAAPQSEAEAVAPAAAAAAEPAEELNADGTAAQPVEAGSEKAAAAPEVESEATAASEMLKAGRQEHKQPAAEAQAAKEKQPAVEVAPAAEPAELAEEAPEMDFDVEPEEEEEAAAKPMDDDGATKAKSPAAKPGKRKHEPIPGVKAPSKVDTAAAGAGDARPNKLRRSDAGGSASLRTPSQSNVPPATPEARGGVSVPLPNMKPTPALRIDGFMRPFTNFQVKALLSQQDCVYQDQDFWMPSIKTHCYVIYETAEQAETIRQATYNIQWPRDSAKRLQPKFVALEEAQDAISNQGGATPRAAPVAAGTTPHAVPATDGPVAVDARREILERRKQREAAQRRQPEEPEDLALDDLFKKTTTWPYLYWLPADKEQVVKNRAEGAGVAVNGTM